MARVGPQLRAALVLFHLTVITGVALPSPGPGANRTTWRDPTVQAEFRAWNERLTSLGFASTSEGLQQRVFGVARDYSALRRRLIEPLLPWLRLTGTGQSWRMFVAPHRNPARLQIDLEQGGVWTPLYRARSGEHAWRAIVFDHDRMRSATFRYAWPPYRKRYAQLVRWIAARVREDFPEATRVRVSYEKYATPSPQDAREGRVPEGRTILARVVSLEPRP
jgi:hypothetical protein